MVQINLTVYAQITHKTVKQIWPNLNHALDRQRVVNNG
jgi:hypothetical protein